MPPLSHQHHQNQLSLTLNFFVSSSLISYCNNTRDFMVPSVWGQVCDRAFSSRAHTRKWLTLYFFSRSTSAKILTLLSSKETAAALLCNGLMTISSHRHDTISLFFVPFFHPNLLIPGSTAP